MIGDAAQHVGRFAGVGNDEELAPSVAPARRLGDRP